MEIFDVNWVAKMVGGVTVAFSLVWVVVVYNALISLRNQVTRAWANIHVILKQRCDEVPQLISLVEQYIQYEQEMLKRLLAARSEYLRAGNLEQQVAASNKFSQSLRGVLMVGEGYPELKANASFLQLQERISSFESTLADRRELYNDATTAYNTRIAQIPDVFIASLFGYRALSLFRVAPMEVKPPSLVIKR